MAYEGLALGAQGWVSGLTNAFPKESVAIYELIKKGEMAQALEIYRWFMEMFIDSYDWVMVPNVYAMSQNADDGLITTKPYFSGSAYVKKMSHHTHSEWSDTWDGLYWRFIWKHADELSKNPRWSMMCAQVRKMDVQKRENHITKAEKFLLELE